MNYKALLTLVLGVGVAVAAVAQPTPAPDQKESILILGGTAHGTGDALKTQPSVFAMEKSTTWASPVR